MPVGSGLATQFGAAEETITNEVQSISGTASGSFTLSFDGATTTSLATNAAAATIQAALEALPNIGTGGVACSGGALPTAVTVTFSGPLVAGRNVPILTVQSGITGLTISTTTPGKGYGDSNTPTRFWEIEQESFKLDIDQLEAAPLRAGALYQRYDRRRQGTRTVSGSVELPVLGRGFGFWLKQAFGKAAVITTPPGGSTSRDQTFTLGDGWNIGTTCQVGRPDPWSDASNVNPYTYLGVKVTALELKLSVGEYLMCKLDLDAKDEEETTALAAASYVATGTKPLDWVGSVVKIAGSPVDVTDITLKVERKLKDDRFSHGATTKKQPVVNDFFDVTVELEGEYLDPVYYRRYSQESSTLPSLTWAIDGDSIEAITGGTAYFGMLWTLPMVVTLGDTPNADGADLLTQKLTMKAVYDGTNELVTCRYRSTDAAS